MTNQEMSKLSESEKFDYLTELSLTTDYDGKYFQPYGLDDIHCIAIWRRMSKEDGGIPLDRGIYTDMNKFYKHIVAIRLKGGIIAKREINWLDL